MTDEAKRAAFDYSTCDAKLWADEFIRVNLPIDQNLMWSWFANAIEAGRNAGYAAGGAHWKERAEKAEAELAALKAERDEDEHAMFKAIARAGEAEAALVKSRQALTDWKAGADSEIAEIRAEYEALRERVRAHNASIEADPNWSTTPHVADSWKIDIMEGL